jgi:hypothetical protein
MCVCLCLLAAVVDVDESKAQQVAQELQLKGARSLAIQADVSSKKDCKRWPQTCTGGMRKYTYSIRHRSLANLSPSH